MTPAGVIETKFGAVALVGFSVEVSGKPQSCIGFAHNFEMPRLQISGWSCQANNPQMQRQAVACALDRLTMLSAGNDPKMAELFARAELKRAGCSHSSPASADWVTATHEQTLRGRRAGQLNARGQKHDGIGRRGQGHMRRQGQRHADTPAGLRNSRK